MLRWLKDRLPTQRRLIQLYAALLHNAHVKGFITGDIYTGNAKALCVPGLNCYSCPGAAGACPLGALQNAIASSGARTPAYVLGILLLFGLTLGRTICDMILAVNRRYGRSDYLPCIAWGSLAHRCAEKTTGDRIGISGRLQSRAYQKRVQEQTLERTAFEVSVMSLAGDEEEDPYLAFMASL